MRYELFRESVGLKVFEHRYNRAWKIQICELIVKNFAGKHFKPTEVLVFACAVEQVTTKKISNLILNVDGCIAVCFVDLLKSCGVYTFSKLLPQ